MSRLVRAKLAETSVERPNDETLLRAWQSGDDAAAERLVRRHFAAVHRFFNSKLPAQAEDLTQRTFQACVESADRWRGEGSFRTYVLGIARLQLMQALRKRHRHEKLFDPMELSLQAVIDDAVPSPTGLVAGRQAERLLLAALRRIPLDFQITVELFYWEQLPIEDIARILEVAVGTVKSRLGRARQMLREQLEALDADPDVARTTVTDLEHWARALRDMIDREG